MKKPVLPENETTRIQALQNLCILDTLPEQRYDRITRIAKAHFQVSISLVSLVDSTRQWFKSRQGLDASETPRDISFCGHAILNEDIFYVPNALEDLRFNDNPLVTGPPNIRFYAGAPLHSPEGERVGTLCIIDDKPRTFSAEEFTILRDLADAVEAEMERTQLLRLASESVKLAMVVEHTDNAVIITDEHGAVEWVNRGFSNISGYTLDDVVGKKPGKVLQGAETDKETIKKISQGIKKGMPVQVEILNYHKNGSPYWLDMQIQPVKDEQGVINNFIAIETDITERKNSEKKLQSNESRIRAIVDTVIDGIITIDAHGMVQNYNPAAQKIFGYNAESVIGKNVKMLMPEPYTENHDTYLHNYLTTGEKKIIGIGREVTGQRQDGSTFPMELAVSEMQIDGERMFTGIVRDITERKHMENMKNEFISTVSHELRTPLTSIRGSLDLVLGGAVGELPSAANDMLSITANNTERLLLLINDILDIQKIESGKMVFRFEAMDIKPFLEQAIGDNQAYADQYNVKFVLKNISDKPRVFADKDRLMQVMANLLSNAAKFSPQGDRVEISVARHDDVVRISVSDHGPGITEDFIPQLFEKFTQTDSSDARQKGGSGLGLSITRLIVEKHGGRIDLVSKEDVGSTFFFELPAMLDIHNDLTKPDMLPGEHVPCVLIVEDDVEIAALLQRMLAEAGFNSDVAYNAREALMLLEQRGDYYKVMTLDILLPDKHGLDLLADLRASAKTHNLPVIVVSAKADEARRELNGGAVGIMDWLSKPIDQARLQQAVKMAAGPGKLPRVLHVEDEQDVHHIVSMMLRNDCDLVWTTTLAASRDALESEEFDLVLLDIGLPDGSGLDLLDLIERRVSPPRIVIFSAQDVDESVNRRVSEVLVKSQTSNDKLLATIVSEMRS